MKDRILMELKENMNKFVSGEKLSVELGISRTAIWKHINELRKEGYEILSSSKKGYKLCSVPDIISLYEISHGLGTQTIGSDIKYFDVIDSTNNYAKKIAQEGCKEGTVVVADTQTLGRGRLGRSWDSPGGKGIWLSVVLRPEMPPYDAQIITLAASVAVVLAIKNTTGIEAQIKWPNDILLGGKKVCGILTEMNSEMDRINYLVLGIGININQQKEDFPEELWDTATSISLYANENNLPMTTLRRSDIIKNMLRELEIIYKKVCTGKTVDILEQWKRYSAVLDRKIRVIYKNSEIIGVAREVTKDGRLVVDCDDGVTREIISGEVSVRGLDGSIALLNKTNNK